MLYALLDGRALLAFDSATGALRWRHWAVSPTALSGPAAIRIQPFFHAGARWLLLQLSSGQWRIVDAADGRTRQEFPASRLPWSADPLALDEDHVVVADGAAGLVCLYLETGTTRWRHLATGPTGLAGKPPRLRLAGGSLLVALERNIGMELDALDPRTGRGAWAAPLFLDRRAINLDDTDSDGKHLFVVTSRGIQSIDLAWGKLTGRFPLPDGSDPDWRVLASREFLLLFPKHSRPAASIDFERELGKAAIYLPTIPRFGRVLGKSYQAWRERMLPMLVLAREDGHVVQHLTFPAAGLAGEVRRTPQGVAIITGAGVWGLELGRVGEKR